MPKRTAANSDAKFSPTKRARAVTEVAHGTPQAKVAIKYGINQSTVSRAVKHAEERGHTKDLPKPGRPRKIDAKTQRVLGRTLRSGAAETAVELHRDILPTVSTETIRHSLRKLGLDAHKKIKKPMLTYQHKRRRLAWAKAHEHWTVDDWRQVIFSDESPYHLIGSAGVQWCWRKPGEAYDSRYIKNTAKHGGGSVMVWGCITGQGRGRIVKCDESVNAAFYQRVLGTGYLGTLKDRSIPKHQHIFQHDGAPAHTSKKIKSLLRDFNVDVLDWPAQSPDMNLIENVWSILDQNVRRRGTKWKNKDELWRALGDEWEKLPDWIIDKLYNSMPDRVAALIKAKGGHTRY